ncbi:hypothetical protein [Deinococcus sp. Marseille-Q6407]|uniref:hypothetical protein n=1 Tax=Deinococcus sp. Marseille-Q6407 TaxID=2969223 RepID=UPI0021BE31E1|nr:hypothetical protein [Deinococcus sp. Marseille-Q6407]
MSTKKGISIGAAMKQRMDKEQQVPQEQELTATLRQPEVQSVSASTEASLNDPLESFNTRLPRSLQRRLKVHVALQGGKIQDVVHNALDEYLTKHGQ